MEKNNEYRAQIRCLLSNEKALLIGVCKAFFTVIRLVPEVAKGTSLQEVCSLCLNCPGDAKGVHFYVLEQSA